MVKSEEAGYGGVNPQGLPAHAARGGRYTLRSTLPAPNPWHKPFTALAFASLCYCSLNQVY